jgi:hypothetical protein
LERLLRTPIHQRRVRVKAAGRLGLLPLSTVAVIRKAEEATADYDAMTLTIAVAYGGREEIVDAVRDLIRAKARDGLGLDEPADHVTPAAIDQYPYTVGLPDPRPHYPHQRRGAPIRLSLVAKRPKRILLHGRLLAGVPQSRLPARDPLVPTENATLRAIRRATRYDSRATLEGPSGVIGTDRRALTFLGAGRADERPRSVLMSCFVTDSRPKRVNANLKTQSP